MDELRVSVDESVGMTELCASVTSGDLQRQVVVAVTYQNRGAVSEYRIVMVYSQRHICRYIFLVCKPCYVEFL